MDEAIPKPTFNVIDPQQLANAFAPIVTQFENTLSGLVDRLSGATVSITIQLPPQNNAKTKS